MAKLLREDIDRFYDYDIHVPSRTIFMGTECDEDMAERFLKAMSLLDPAGTEITVVMNNTGGDEYHGMAIYDAIACSKCYVTVIAYGHAMSMGSWILQAADKRIMAPNATLMIHYGTWLADDHVKYFRVQNKEMERINGIMENVYLSRLREIDPKFPARKIRKMLEDEMFLSASDAVGLGLADKVLE